MAICKLIKTTVLYDSICGFMKTKNTGVVTSMGTTTTTSCGPLTNWSPYCEPLTTFTGDGCTDSNPSMLLTVSWTDCNTTGPAVTGCTVSWFGHVFYNGQTIEVCPTDYTKEKNSFTGYFADPVAGDHYWQKLEGTDNLALSRHAADPTNYGNFSGQNRIQFGIGGAALLDRKDTIAGGFTVSTFDIGVLTAGIGMPAINNYSITDAFFGSFTTGGITYAWAKGIDWP